MKQFLRSMRSLLVLFGLDPVKPLATVWALPAYFRDLKLLREQSRDGAAEFPFGRLYPCLGDRSADSGSARGDYFHQDLLVARRIHLNRPRRHVDVGSRVDGFVAHVASFRVIEVIDIRPLTNSIPNIVFKQVDVTAPVTADLLEICDSLSCLHALEHFGLGRYGDPVRYDGYLSALNNLYLMLKRGGKLYFSVPIGRQRIEFNAHRVFSVRYLLELFRDKYRIDMFSVVDDRGDLHEAVPLPLVEGDVQRNFGCSMGCGIFELTKL
jgi:hypothetical protein